jgi:hypothetical protein
MLVQGGKCYLVGARTWQVYWSQRFTVRGTQGYDRRKARKQRAYAKSGWRRFCCN